jgi:hypothetical protein
MAAKPLTNTANSGVDELLVHNDAVSLCLLVNRRQRTLRIIDFRAGPTLAKRSFVVAAAKREGVEKIFTLVERDEVATWTRLGFTREGSIPSFYKRTDAWILGAVVGQIAPVRAVRALAETDDDDESEGEGEGRTLSPAAALAERTIARARRLLKSAPEVALPAVKVALASEALARKALSAAQRSGRALTGFEPFSRDAPRRAFTLSTRSGGVIVASVETQSCFGNSFFELLTAPRTEAERLVATSAVSALEARLKAEGAVSTFTLAAADDVTQAAVFLGAGFRRSGVLAQHVMLKGERKDAIVWSKKLAGAGD